MRQQSRCWWTNKQIAGHSYDDDSLVKRVEFSSYDKTGTLNACHEGKGRVRHDSSHGHAAQLRLLSDKPHMWCWSHKIITELNNSCHLVTPRSLPDIVARHIITGRRCRWRKRAHCAASRAKAELAQLAQLITLDDDHEHSRSWLVSHCTFYHYSVFFVPRKNFAVKQSTELLPQWPHTSVRCVSWLHHFFLLGLINLVLFCTVLGAFPYGHMA